MENKGGKEKPPSSKKSNLIIITPDELAKLGLTPGIIHPTVEDKPNKQANADKTKEKPNRKSIKQSRQINKSKDLNISSKLFNLEVENAKKSKDPSPIVVNSKILSKKLDIVDLPVSIIENPTISEPSMSNLAQSMPSTASPKILNSKIKFSQRKLLAQKKANKKNFKIKLTTCSSNTKELTKGSSSRGKDREVQNSKLKLVNKNQKTNYIHVNASSSLNNCKLKSTEFHEVLQKGLSKKLQHDIIEQNESDTSDNIPEKLNLKAESSFKNSDNDNMNKFQSHNSVHTNITNKGVKITSNTPLCLSSEELKQLASKARKSITFCQKNENINCDVKEAILNLKNNEVDSVMESQPEYVANTHDKEMCTSIKLQINEVIVATKDSEINDHGETLEETRMRDCGLVKENKLPCEEHLSIKENEEKKIIKDMLPTISPDKHVEINNVGKAKNHTGTENTKKNIDVELNIDNNLTSKTNKTDLEFSSIKNTKTYTNIRKNFEKIKNNNTFSFPEDHDTTSNATHSEEENINGNELECSKEIKINNLAETAGVTSTPNETPNMIETCMNQGNKNIISLAKIEEDEMVVDNKLKEDKIETPVKKNYANENSTQNFKLNKVPLISQVKNSKKFKKRDGSISLNEELQSTSKTSVNIPKKRKYVNISKEEAGITQKTTQVEKIYDSDIKPINAATNSGKGNNNHTTKNEENNCPNEILTVPRKRGRKKKNISNDSLPKEDIKINVETSELKKSKTRGIIKNHEMCLSENEPITYLNDDQTGVVENKSCNIKKENQENPNVKSSLNDNDVDKNKNNSESLEKEQCVSYNEIQVMHDKKENTRDEALIFENNLEQQIHASKVNVKLPRKRGRPKKILIKGNDSLPYSNINTNEDSPTINSDEGILNHSQKKVRTNEPATVDTKLPRNKEQPKKISETEDNNDAAVFSMKENSQSVSVLPKSDTNPQLVVASSTSLPKKRGRKRKSEQPPPEVGILDESRSGRKRRKVNYMELLNELGTIENEPKKRNKFCINNIGKVNTSKKQDIECLDNVEDNVQQESDLYENSNSNNNELNKTEKKDEFTNEESNSDVSFDKSNKSERTLNYKKTGETVLMMNSVFAAAVKNKARDGTENDENLSTERSSSDIIPMNTNSARGRRRKSQELEKIIIDKDNMVTCVSCNEKVNNNDWKMHNRQKHNNLAYREGESELDLTNGNLVSKILKPILKEDKMIKCAKCNSSFKIIKNFMDHMETCNGVISSKGLVTCAICKIEMEKTKWPNHKQRQHNNLAWRIGDHPLNLNDQNLVVSILTALYKAKKPLTCEKCGISKKSVIGFLSHQSQCGLEIEEVKVKCKFCEKKVLPVSMQTHVKMVHETPKRNEEFIQESSRFDIDTDPGLKKRKAAEMAMFVLDKFCSEKTVQEYSKFYLRQVNFVEENFIKLYLQKELANNKIVKCRFNNCSFESDSAISLVEHMNNCELKPEEYYTCRRCLAICDNEREIRVHLKNNHKIEIANDEYIATDYNQEVEADEKWEQYHSDIKKGARLEKLKSEKDPNYRIKPTCILNLSKNPNQLFSQSYNYTMSFCQEHYSINQLFKHLRNYNSDWVLLDDDLIEEYLPKFAQSCDVARKQIKNNESVLGSDYILKKFELFESECDEGIATIFCGGPIHAMSWMPTPHTSLECRQVLAVAAASSFDKKYLVNQQYNEQSVIQFWDFGLLVNKCAISEPKLMFCLAHDFGPVWHLEWCPSGCFDLDITNEDSAEISRMGLLAVAGSDSTVYIYSIPHLEEEQMGLVYKVKPLLKLHVTPNEKQHLSYQKFYATKISWSKASGHRHIAVGFTDGVVSLFNIDTTSNLLRCKDEDDCEIIFPYKTFQPHTHTITVLDLIHLGGGQRWLLTGSLDRSVTVWDLNNDFKISYKRNIISDGLWLTNWIAFVTANDESSSGSDTVPTPLTSYRDYLYERVNLTYSSSSTKSISGSNWLNGIVWCNSLGQITAMFPHQLLYSLDNQKTSKRRVYLLGYTKLINKFLTPQERLTEAKIETAALATGKNKKSCNAEKVLTSENSHDNKYEPITYQEANEKYGLLFCDSKMDSFKDFIKKGEVKKPDVELETSKPTLYSLQAINKVAYNPNLQASLYYATGYQAGFVRVTYMKYLENDPQIK